ncbi:MAG: TPM domain-containing protein [Paracoccaceae bacterium]
MLLLFVAPIAAQTYPDPESTTVNDFAGILSDEAEALLTTQLDTLRSETGVVMTVVTLSRKETFAPDQSAEEFARGLFDEWKIGDGARNDGVLFLVLHGDREVRIQLGAAYGQDWQLATRFVLSRSILPAFKQERYEDGIRAGVSDTITRIIEPYLVGAKAPETDGTGSPTSPTEGSEGGSPENGGGLGGWWAALIFAPIALLIGWGAMKSKLAKCPQCGNRGLSVTSNRLEEPTETAPGRGERITECKKCGHRSVKPYVIPAKATDAKDTSPPDMGGGKSGKGGATGKW